MGAKPKHYQTGADSCACGEVWPCRRRSKRAARPNYAKSSTVHGGPGGKWTLVVGTRANGPTFVAWWNQAIAAARRLDHEVDLWNWVEQGRDCYQHFGEATAFADSVVKRDRQLRQDVLDAHNVRVVRTKIGDPDVDVDRRVDLAMIQLMLNMVGTIEDCLASLKQGLAELKERR